MALVQGAAEPHSTLTVRWQDAAVRLLSRYRSEGTHVLLAPALAEGELLLEAMVAEVCEAAGECGPIARSALHSAVLLKVIGTVLMMLGAQHPDGPDSRAALSLFKTGSVFLDQSQSIARTAQESAVRIANLKTAAVVDPLAAWMVPAESAIPGRADE